MAPVGAPAEAAAAEATVGIPTGAAGAAAEAKLNHLVAAQLCKTKMCAMFARGSCVDPTCRFAHSPDELRAPPDLTKTAICRAFQRGQCRNPACKFAHGQQELRVTPSVYKTQICHFFDRGHCKKGDRCRHAHGSNELRAFEAAGQAEPEHTLVEPQPRAAAAFMPDFGRPDSPGDGLAGWSMPGQPLTPPGLSGPPSPVATPPPHWMAPPARGAAEPQSDFSPTASTPPPQQERQSAKGGRTRQRRRSGAVASTASPVGAPHTPPPPSSRLMLPLPGSAQKGRAPLPAAFGERAEATASLLEPMKVHSRLVDRGWQLSAEAAAMEQAARNVQFAPQGWYHLLASVGRAYGEQMAVSGLHPGAGDRDLNCWEQELVQYHTGGTGVAVAVAAQDSGEEGLRRGGMQALGSPLGHAGGLRDHAAPSTPRSLFPLDGPADGGWHPGAVGARSVASWVV